MTILDLSHNKLKGLAPEAFDKHSYSTELRLNNNQVEIKNIDQIKIVNKNIDTNTL